MKPGAYHAAYGRYEQYLRDFHVWRARDAVEARGSRGREQVSREILERAAARTAYLGIELLDLRIKRINYVDEVQQDVFARMIAERQRIAELYRSARPRASRANASASCSASSPRRSRPRKS